MTKTAPFRIYSSAEFTKMPPPRSRWRTAPRSKPVPVRGEALSEPIYWTGTQWVVTAFGIEARDGTYAIAKDRLWEDEAVGGWFLHMSEKNWVNVRDFANALAVARTHFRDLWSKAR